MIQSKSSFNLNYVGPPIPLQFCSCLVTIFAVYLCLITGAESFNY